jgi:hypothetical protein
MSRMGTGEGRTDAAAADAAEFVRFCYRRRRMAWPEIYDDMCAVAARGSFRGWGYVELAERGVRFTLADLPRLAALVERVVHEERRATVAATLASAPGSA